MKKIVSGIMALALALLLIVQPDNTVKAEGVSLGLSASTVNVGGSVTATVSCPSGYGVDVILSVDNTAVLSGGNDTVVVIGDAAGQSNSASVSFSAVGAGTCTITATVRSAGDADGNPVDFGGASATVTVNNAAQQPTDTNGGNTGSNTGGTTDGGDAAQTTQSSDNTLKSIVLSNGSLSPAFSPKTKNYTATVDNSVTSLSISATPTDQTAKVTSVSGNDNLQVGENTITITVKAENGVTTTYTIVVTRRDATDPENSEAQEEKKTYEINGSNWGISTEITEDEVMQDFTLSSILIDNLEYPCLSFNNGSLDLIKMVSEDGLNTGFFVYDKDQGAIYPFAKISGEEHYVIILMPDTADVPSDYAEVTLAIEGKADVTAYQKADDELYLIYCINDRGEKGWYQYDPVEGTYIRYVAPVETVEQVVEEQNPDTALQAEVANLKLERTIILAVCGIILVILLIIIIALAIRVANSRKDVLRELEEEDSDDELDEELFEDADEQEQDDEIINLDISDDSTDVDNLAEDKDAISDNIADMVIVDTEGANIEVRDDINEDSHNNGTKNDDVVETKEAVNDNIVDIKIRGTERTDIEVGDDINQNSHSSSVENEDAVANKAIINNDTADMKINDVASTDTEDTSESMLPDENADSEPTEKKVKKEKKEYKRWGKKKEQEPEEDDDITFIDL